MTDDFTLSALAVAIPNDIGVVKIWTRTDRPLIAMVLSQRLEKACHADRFRRFFFRDLDSGETWSTKASNDSDWFHFECGGLLTHPDKAYPIP